MDKKTKTPIELMADLLATMTARAIEAERQLDEAKKSSDEWYQHWQDKDAALKEAEAKLRAEIGEHQETRRQLREALNNQEGEQNNG
jgi:chromosome segregation ATPase